MPEGWLAGVRIGLWVLIVISAAVAVMATFRLARWAQAGPPLLWALAAAAPYVNVLVFVLLSRDALRELRKRDVAVQW